jgi:septum formation protein
MNQPTTIYLASQSPRRLQLLKQLGFTPTVLSLTDHPNPDPDPELLEAAMPEEDPKDYVQRVTLLKLQRGLDTVLQSKTYAADFMNQNGSTLALVLAADTTVAVGSEILGKPQDKADAVRMLKLLSGKTHQVHTAVAVCGHPAAPMQTLVTSQVTFAELSNDWIEDYVASGEPMDKAGAYGIQGAAGAMIPRINGSYAAIMGLPLYETLTLIKSATMQLKQ